ncbi:hypothetical protein GE061_007926 [Apolygus lucorum]|uniref:Uncharacterized protein n=1 Tax=Apolygus lucorum TaxID=248454 RepID=A0A6A4IKK7_APOLU|nr:hypothetical protein GE061_007926 [Apolygus lucorum]
MASKNLADTLHRVFVLACFGTTLYGTAIVGHRFTQYFLYGRHRTLEITNQDPAAKIDPEQLTDGPTATA